MADPQDLLRLAEAVEKATGPDRALDIAIAVAIGWSPPGVDARLFSDAATRTIYAHRVPRFTASLDAAMTLIGSDAYWRLGNDGEGPDVSAFKATVTSGDGPTLAFHEAVAATPALALCAAALKARAHSTKESDNAR